MTRNHVALIGAMLAGLLHPAAIAAPAATFNPPAQWAGYIEAVRKADRIVDDETRCKTYPDLPGNEWRHGAAQARCTLLRKPAWTLDQIDRLLDQPGGIDELERGFAALLKGHYEDQAQREQIFRAFLVFDESTRSQQVSLRWLKLAPKSAFANTAAGSHYGSAGWKARGGAYADETPAENLKRMSRLFEQALPLYAKALEIEPRLSVACHRLAAIGRQSSDALQRNAIDHCTRVDPDSYHVAYERMVGAEPRWGGSDDQLRAAVAYAAARVERNPILGALLAEAAGYDPSRADSYVAVADELAAVSRMAPSGTLMAHAGNGYWRRGDHWEALVHLSQATRFWPRNARFRYERAAVLYDWLGDNEWAASDVGIAVEEAPTNGVYLHLLGRVTRTLEGDLAARPFFARAMEDPKRRGKAMEMYCQTYFDPLHARQAEQCTRDLLTEFPQSGEGWRLLAFVLYHTGRPEAGAAIDRFIEYARPDDDVHRSEVEVMKRWRAKLQGMPLKEDHAEPRAGASGS